MSEWGEEENWEEGELKYRRLKMVVGCDEGNIGYMEKDLNVEGDENIIEKVRNGVIGYEDCVGEDYEMIEMGG